MLIPSALILFPVEGELGFRVTLGDVGLYRGYRNYIGLHGDNIGVI